MKNYRFDPALFPELLIQQKPSIYQAPTVQQAQAEQLEEIN
jgi:hypothetical protein